MSALGRFRRFTPLQQYLGKLDPPGVTRPPNNPLNSQFPLRTPLLGALRHVQQEPLIEPEPDAVQFLGRERCCVSAARVPFGTYRHVVEAIV